MRLSLGNIPTTLKLIAIDVADDAAISRTPDLPGGWQANEPTTQAVGNAWLDSGEGLLLQLASALLPYSRNYLVNAGHPQAATQLIESEVAQSAPQCSTMHSSITQISRKSQSRQGHLEPPRPRLQCRQPFSYCDMHILCIYSGDTRVDIEWDPVKAASNFRKHGIRFSDVEPAFYDDGALSMPDTLSVGEERFLFVGTDALGRTVTISYTFRRDSIRVISARRATKSERKAYEKGVRLQ
ncbi:MAG TPA: BrnT family toxin [Woeseiaceae bacterium]|nr:BrnT family toxin [Woeseiaceae bacterium]